MDIQGEPKPNPKTGGRLKWLLAVLLLIIGATWRLRHGRVAAAEPGFCTGTGSQAPVAVALAAPYSLNGVSKAWIYSMREQTVARYPQFVAPGYAPNDAIFGRIENGKPWWGMKGIYLYSSGPRSIEGVSEESRFLANPLLLVALREPLALDTERQENPVNLAPTPSNLFWDCAANTASVTYDITKFFDFTDSLHNYPGNWNHVLWFIAYNAQDLGFDYIYLAPDLSQNVTMREDFPNPIKIAQFIHCGDNCGYPGGCNNMSSANRLYLRIAALPAKAVFKLWRKSPASGDDKADATFIIDMR